MNIVTSHGKIYIFFYRALQFVGTTILRICYRVEIINKEAIPKEGRLILCSNHMSYIDPVFICLFFPRVVYYIAKKELFDIKVLRRIITFYNAFPVNRGNIDMKLISTSLRVLKAEQVLGVFPEGTRSVDGKIREGQRGVGLISFMAKAPILTMAISNTNKIVQKPRKRLFFPKVKLIFGDLIDPEDFDFKNNKSLASSQMVEQIMLSIKRNYDQINKE
jgi:1-acyl-sn-glycerol-3-phosphate acyltransferase